MASQCSPLPPMFEDFEDKENCIAELELALTPAPLTSTPLRPKQPLHTPKKTVAEHKNISRRLSMEDLGPTEAPVKDTFIHFPYASPDKTKGMASEPFTEPHNWKPEVLLPDYPRTPAMMHATTPGSTAMRGCLDLLLPAPSAVPPFPVQQQYAASSKVISISDCLAASFTTLPPQANSAVPAEHSSVSVWPQYDSMHMPPVPPLPLHYESSLHCGSQHPSYSNGQMLVHPQDSIGCPPLPLPPYENSQVSYLHGDHLSIISQLPPVSFNAQTSSGLINSTEQATSHLLEPFQLNSRYAPLRCGVASAPSSDSCSATCFVAESSVMSRHPVQGSESFNSIACPTPSASMAARTVSISAEHFPAPSPEAMVVSQTSSVSSSDFNRAHGDGNHKPQAITLAISTDAVETSKPSSVHLASQALSCGGGDEVKEPVESISIRWADVEIPALGLHEASGGNSASISSSTSSSCAAAENDARKSLDSSSNIRGRRRRGGSGQ